MRVAPDDGAETIVLFAELLGVVNPFGLPSSGPVIIFCSLMVARRRDVETRDFPGYRV